MRKIISLHAFTTLAASVLLAIAILGADSAPAEARGGFSAARISISTSGRATMPVISRSYSRPAVVGGTNAAMYAAFSAMLLTNQAAAAESGTQLRDPVSLSTYGVDADLALGTGDKVLLALTGIFCLVFLGGIILIFVEERRHG